MSFENGQRSREKLGVALAIVFALLLHASCLGWGFYADDHGIELVLEGATPHPTLRPWSLYDFGEAPRPGDALDRAATFPWWTSPDWKVRFFRPLASLSLALDQRCFGRSAPAHHASGLALFGCLLALAYALYRALGIAHGVALLAVVLFACVNATLVPVGWPANRNSLIEAAFSVAALLVLARARDPSPARIAGALALSAGAFLSKESGVAAPLACALYLALEARGADAGPARARKLAGALAGAALAALYLAALLARGYGARSAFYPTPWGAPAEFARRLGIELGAGAVALVAPFPVDLLAFEPRLALPGLALALALALPVAILVAREARTLAHAPLLAAWALLALLPQGGAPPSDRLLFVSALGTAPLVAHFLARTLSRDARPRRSRALRAVALAVAVLALPVSALALVARGFAFGQLFGKLNASVAQAEVGPPELGERDAFLLQSPSALTALVPAATYVFETGDRRVRFFPLQMGRRGVRWTRVDERTFDLESLGAPFLTELFEGVFLSSRAPPAPGQRWRTSAFEVEALAVEAGGLRSFRVRCDEMLDATRMRFLIWRDGRLRRVAPPEIGRSLELAQCEPLAPHFP